MAAGPTRSAFVLGYTGETGKALVKELSQQQYFKNVVLIGRRKVDLPEDINKDFEQKVVDFDKISEHKEAFQDCQVGFCCLGTTKGKSGMEGFVKVDRDYVIQSAEVAKAAGCEHFNLVSSTGADKSSSILLYKTKAEAEEGVEKIKFDRLTIYRPGLLLCNREESRPLEAIARACVRPFAALFPTTGTITTKKLAKALISVSLREPDQTKSVELLDNNAIHKSVTI